MATCIDYRDQVSQNTRAITPGPNINFQGEYTLNQIAVFTDELAENIRENAETNPLVRARNRFGDTLDESTNYLNSLFRDLISDRLSDFPEAERRWSRGNITVLEVADFIDQYNYTPQGIIDQTDYLKLLREIDSYYVDSFADSLLGGFCKTLQNIFQQIEAFYDLIGVVEGIIGDVLSLVNKIQNFDGFEELKDQTLIEYLKTEIEEAITEIVGQVMQEVEDAIANFNINGIIGELKGGTLASVKAIMTTKEQMCAFFTEDNKKTIKDRVRGLINYAMSLFERPSLDQIRYMVFRFCALATNIELLIRDIKKPLDDYGFRYQRIVKRMAAISNINTSTAIRNSAIRYSPERRQESINRLRALWNGESGTPITPTGEELKAVKPITAEEYQELPVCGKVFKGEDNRVAVEGDWVKDLGITGYTRIDLDVKVYLMRVQAEIGGKYTITRGWYSKDYNDSVEGDPENSHLSGLVIDIKVDPLEFDTDDFVESALKNGFKYVVVKGDEIHLDIREIPR